MCSIVLWPFGHQTSSFSHQLTFPSFSVSCLSSISFHFPTHTLLVHHTCQFFLAVILLSTLHLVFWSRSFIKALVVHSSAFSSSAKAEALAHKLQCLSEPELSPSWWFLAFWNTLWYVILNWIRCLHIAGSLCPYARLLTSDNMYPGVVTKCLSIWGTDGTEQLQSLGY